MYVLFTFGITLNYQISSTVTTPNVSELSGLLKKVQFRTSLNVPKEVSD